MLDRRTHAVDLALYAVNGRQGRTVEDPVYQAIVEHRRRPNRPVSNSYSCCGDLCHWLLYRLGCREPWINREEHQGWRSQVNVSRLVPPHVGTNQAAKWHTPEMPIEPGDILLVDGHLSTAHVMVVLSLTASTLTTADYGQAPTQATPTTIVGAIRDRVVQWRPMQQDWPFGHKRARALFVAGRRVDSVLSLDSIPWASPVQTVESWSQRFELRRGSRGPGVERMQRELAKLGLYTLRVDGDFGPGTEGALRQFQARAGLPVTGVFDSVTSKRLYASRA